MDGWQMGPLFAAQVASAMGVGCFMCARAKAAKHSTPAEPRAHVAAAAASESPPKTFATTTVKGATKIRSAPGKFSPAVLDDGGEVFSLVYGQLVDVLAEDKDKRGAAWREIRTACNRPGYAASTAYTATGWVPADTIEVVDLACMAMPAEWEQHACCVVGFPFFTANNNAWRQNAAPAQQQYALVIEAIAAFEPVTVLVSPLAMEAAKLLLTPLRTEHPIQIVSMEMDDAWLRDTGPIGLVCRSSSSSSKPVVGTAWKFNAWGEYCYLDWRRDAEVGWRVCQLNKIPCIAVPMVLEGGSIHTDGQGTLLTTAECLLEPNGIGKQRNPGLSKQEIEGNLERYLVSVDSTQIISPTIVFLRL